MLYLIIIPGKNLECMLAFMYLVPSGIDSHMDTKSVFAVRGLRCTRQRIVLYEALMKNNTHPTAEQLFDMVRGQCPGLSLATVYNTLEILCRAGLCRRLPTTRSSSRYDADTRPHLHAVNSETGDVRDIPDDLSREVIQNLPQTVIRDIEERLGMSVDRISIQFIGRDQAHPLEDKSRNTGAATSRA